MTTDITLISQTLSKNSMGQQIATETSTVVFAEIKSVTRAEFNSASRVGITPDLVVITPAINYSNQRIAMVDGNRYVIYRTFRQQGSDSIELYLGTKTGA